MKSLRIQKNSTYLCLHIFPLDKGSMLFCPTIRDSKLCDAILCLPQLDGSQPFPKIKYYKTSITVLKISITGAA